MRLRCLMGSWLLLVVLTVCSAGNARPPTIHTVYPGQRLASIAKRYHVTVEDLCEANNIGRNERLRVGQKLTIPTGEKVKSPAAKPSAAAPASLPVPAAPPAPSPVPAEPSGEELATESEKAEPSAPAALDPESAEEGQPSDPEAIAHHQPEAAAQARAPLPTAAKPRPQRGQQSVPPPRIHTVYSGQRLGSIAKRYQVSVEAICNASGIPKGAKLRPGQKLLIPAKDDTDGELARQMYQGNFGGSAKSDSRPIALAKGAKPSYKLYLKKPRKRGYVTLTGYTRSWKGYAFGPSGRVLPKARTEISALLNASPEWPEVEPRLMRLLVELSDKFGGRELRIISGLREKSFVQDSRHHLGRAVDFTIIGVPNEALRDYLLTLEKVGVGYYPNSTFVHLDVRDEKAHWIDYSGPGEPPVLAPPSLARENLRRAEQAATH